MLAQVRRQMCMFRQSRRIRGVVIGACVLALAVSAVAQQHRTKPVPFGFVSLTTVQAPNRRGQPDAFAGGVVVRFQRNNGSGEILALTNDSGTAIVPLRAGTYCAKAYGTDANLLKLDDRVAGADRTCIEIKAGQTVEFSLTLAPDVKYLSTIPSLGIR
jgi:hypothetical protein